MRSFKVWSKIEIGAENRKFWGTKQFVQKSLKNLNFGQKNKIIKILFKKSLVKKSTV